MTLMGGSSLPRGVAVHLTRWRRKKDVSPVWLSTILELADTPWHAKPYLLVESPVTLGG